MTDEDNIERSKSGSPIYRHEKAAEGDHAVSDTSNMEAVEAHVEKYLGKIETVWHEIASDKIHLDVHVLPATVERPYKILVTTGVSDLPMNIPDGVEAYDRVELLMVLPPDWPLSQEDFSNEANYWPVRWLKSIGRLPHEYDTWIGWGHSIPNGDPAEPIADTEFVGFVLQLPYWVDQEFFTMETDTGEVVAFYQIVPIYAEEMQLKLDEGHERLEDLFDRYNIDFVLDKSRKNVAKKPKGLFDRFFEKK